MHYLFLLEANHLPDEVHEFKDKFGNIEHLNFRNDLRLFMSRYQYTPSIYQNLSQQMSIYFNRNWDENLNLFINLGYAYQLFITYYLKKLYQSSSTGISDSHDDNHVYVHSVIFNSNNGIPEYYFIYCNSYEANFLKIIPNENEKFNLEIKTRGQFVDNIDKIVYNRQSLLKAMNEITLNIKNKLNQSKFMPKSIIESIKIDQRIFQQRNVRYAKIDNQLSNMSRIRSNILNFKTEYINYSIKTLNLYDDLFSLFDIIQNNNLQIDFLKDKEKFLEKYYKIKSQLDFFNPEELLFEIDNFYQSVKSSVYFNKIEDKTNYENNFFNVKIINIENYRVKLINALINSAKEYYLYLAKSQSNINDLYLIESNYSKSKNVEYKLSQNIVLSKDNINKFSSKFSGISYCDSFSLFIKSSFDIFYQSNSVSGYNFDLLSNLINKIIETGYNDFVLFKTSSILTKILRKNVLIHSENYKDSHFKIDKFIIPKAYKEAEKNLFINIDKIEKNLQIAVKSLEQDEILIYNTLQKNTHDLRILENIYSEFYTNIISIKISELFELITNIKFNFLSKKHQININSNAPISSTIEGKISLDTFANKDSIENYVNEKFSRNSVCEILYNIFLQEINKIENSYEKGLFVSHNKAKKYSFLKKELNNRMNVSKKLIMNFIVRNEQFDEKIACKIIISTVFFGLVYDFKNGVYTSFDGNKKNIDEDYISFSEIIQKHFENKINQSKNKLLAECLIEVSNSNPDKILDSLNLPNYKMFKQSPKTL